MEVQIYVKVSLQGCKVYSQILLEMYVYVFCFCTKYFCYFLKCALLRSLYFRFEGGNKRKASLIWILIKDGVGRINRIENIYGQRKISKGKNGMLKYKE